MSTTLRRPPAVSLPAASLPLVEVPAEPRATVGPVVLEGVSWSQYVALRDLPENGHVRMTFDRGRLELMSPKYRSHERPHHLLCRLVQTWTEVRNIPISTGGETTLRREDLGRGAEPDESFHIQSEAAVRTVDDLVLPEFPPPDLVIEADVTSSSVPRLPIYAALGVQEVWRWRNERVTVLALQEGDYVEREASGVLPGFPLDEARRVLAARRETDETTLLRQFRAFVAATA